MADNKSSQNIEGQSNKIIDEEEIFKVSGGIKTFEFPKYCPTCGDTTMHDIGGYCKKCRTKNS